MKIYGAMLVKDEADILRECIQDALRWVDGLFILDNGSTDGSWEILQSMKSDVVVPWKQDFAPYRRSMRADIFNEFRSVSRDGDWWFVADADEFFVDDPKEFLAKVPKEYHVVFKKSLDYFITEEDVAEYEFSGDFSRDREHLRYMDPTCWAEIRFFKYRDRLRWDPVSKPQEQKPAHVGLWYPEPIIVKHYQYRSPAQMQARLDVRNKIPRDKEGRPFRHITQTKWTELLRKRADLVEDRGYEQYKALPLRRDIQEKPLDRLVKRVLHGTGILP
jgi:hypothetical protein